jgi:hypothetical protein
MTPNKTIILSVIIYIILLIILVIIYHNTKFTGSDAAGNGMAKGLIFLYGLVFLFLAAIVVTIINAFFFSGITQQWIKFLFFVPIVLPSIIFAHEVLEIGKSRPPDIDKQAHRLSIEIRSTQKLENPSLAFRTSGGSSFGKLELTKSESDYFYYKVSRTIYYESERKFYIASDKVKTVEYFFDIPYKPEIIPFTEWYALSVSNDSIQDTISMEFRYQVTK